jgi:hypothetical protein
MHRPMGVTILSLLSGMYGGLGLSEGMGLIAAPVTEHFAAPISGLVLAGLRILAGGGCLAFAYGAWRLRPWAWTLGIVILVVAVVFVALAEGFIQAAAEMPVSLLLVFYLDRASVREAFGLRSQP